PFAERHTRIEYRPGSAAEAARINRLLPRTVPVVASRNLRSGIRVRLVLGHDLQRNVVAWEQRGLSQTVAAGLAGMTLPDL
ncbi:MAG: LytR C-terminal domain-containing protein, partial [Hyphomicrobiaceae bacterium]